MPPIYQPEVAARAVVYAADHPAPPRVLGRRHAPRRTLVANAVAPGLLDRYLARTGFAVAADRPARDPDQPANLWEPADGTAGHDYGAHGVFDREARAHSPQQWAAHHYPLLAAVLATGVAGALATAVRRRA